MDEQGLVRVFGREIEKIIDNRALVNLEGYPFNNRKIQDIKRYICEPEGQLIRPRILLETARSYNANERVALTCAAIIEIVHSVTLALDDIMDDALLRRNKKVTFRKYGLDRTILACYDLNPLVNEAIYSLPLNIELRREISQEINKTQMMLTQGQEYDTSQTNRAKNLEDFAKIFELKTGSLIGAATTIGGLIGNAREGDIEKLRKFGVYLGIAYQFFDDWKDRYCSEKEVGKSVGLDARKTTPFDITRPELLIAEYFKYRELGMQELGEIKGRNFENIIGITLGMFTMPTPKRL